MSTAIKMPVKRELIYPQFLEACRYAIDIFWEGILEDLAYGKPPYGTYISSNSLCCSYKDRKFSYKIEKKDSKELYDEVFELLSSRMKLLSQRDKIQRRIEFYSDIEDNLENLPETFAEVRKKSTQDLLIERFVIHAWTNFNLTLSQAKRLLSILYIGRVLKNIRSKDIVMVDGVIASINGISITDKKIRYDKDLLANSTTAKNSNLVLVEKARLADTWDKLLGTLRKQ